MDTRTLGSSKLQVSCIGLGGMPMSVSGRPSEREAIAVVHAALDAGMSFIDTADVYCVDHRDIGHNERLIAKALREAGRSDVVVATKGGLQRPDGAWTTNGEPAHIQAACEASLRALGVDAIDVYQLHAPCDNTPYADTLGALARLKEQGKVKHLGLSNVSVAEIEQASELFDVVSVQNRCNPLDVRPWRDGVLPHCEAHGIAFLPWSPVGGGREKGAVGRDPVLRRVGARHGASAYEVALAWLLARSPVMIPIPGASRVESARSSARAADLRLGDGDLAELEAAFMA